MLPLLARDGGEFGGGALLDPHSRAALEATGLIVCLRAAPEVLLQRLAVDGPERAEFLTNVARPRLEELTAVAAGYARPWDGVGRP